MRRHLYVLLMVAALATWFMLLRPLALGGPATYVMVSGMSMQPTLHNGDLVVLQKQDSYGKGDVIAYAIPQGSIGAGKLVIHRIIGGTPSDGFVTQGDNRDKPDDWHPKLANVKGSLWVQLPGVGKTVSHLRTPPIFAAIAGGFTVFSLILRTPPGRKEGESTSTDGAADVQQPQGGPESHALEEVSSR